MISPRFAETICGQVHLFSQNFLRLLLKPLGAEVAAEVEAAFESTFSDAGRNSEMVRFVVRLISHPDFSKLLEALRERQGHKALEQPAMQV